MPAYEEVKLVSEASIFALGLASTVFMSACSQLFELRLVPSFTQQRRAVLSLPSICCCAI